MIALEWVSMFASFAGTGLIAYHVREGWLLCAAADGGFVVFALRKRLYGFLTLCFVYLILNCIGWVKS